jgi:hypothetical protein
MNEDRLALIVAITFASIVAIVAFMVTHWVSVGEWDKAELISECNSMNLSDHWEEGYVVDLQNQCYKLSPDKIG